MKASKSSRFNGPKSFVVAIKQVKVRGLINEFCDSNDFEIESPMAIFSFVLTFWNTANEDTDLWPVTDMFRALL